MSTPYVGEIRLFAFPRVPIGWLLCDGSLQPISTYDALYAVMGTAYGGDGVNTFGLPDLRGQTPIHNGTGPGLTTRVVGELGGTEQVSLSSNQMPAHTHNLMASQGAASASVPTGALLGTPSTDTLYMTAIGTATKHTLHAQTVATVGGGVPHDNTMPTLTVSACIAFQGIFPQQG